MNIVSKLKNGVGGNLSKFTGLASIVTNALILPPIYYFFRLIQARHKGSKATNYKKYDDVKELVEASPNNWYAGKLISDPRKEKGVMAGKASIYRLTCVIGSIISLALSILSLYSFISSLRFKNQMNAWGISFALLSPLVAAVTIFLQGESVSRDGSKLIKIIAEGIGINRPHSTIRDVNHYYESEPMVESKTYTYKITTNSKVRTYKVNITKPYYASFVCALSLSFAAFAQSIAVYKLPNTMRISAFVVCANLCFALSKLIFDAYYVYQCNIYDEKNRVVVMGERIREHGVGAESYDERSRSLLQIRLAGKAGELRGALNTKLNEIMGLIQKIIKDRPEEIHIRGQLVAKAALLRLALNSLKKPFCLKLIDITDNENIAMNIMHEFALTVGEGESAIYSTEFNGSNLAVLKADACPDLTQQLEEGAYIHRFKGGKVKMEDQHICYEGPAAEPLMNGEIDICKVHNNIETEPGPKATVTSLELVALVLAAKNSDIVVGDAIDAIEQAIQEVTTKAGEKEGVFENPAEAFNIDPERLLQHIKSIEDAFDFKVKKMATAGA